MRRVIISGGGTGGHIYPAVTIAEAIKATEPTEILYIGSKQGLENTLIPKLGYEFMTLDVRGLERKLSVHNIVTLCKTAGSLFGAGRIIHTSRMNKAKLPTHIALAAAKYALPKDSVVLLEQIRTIDKQRLREKVCHLDTEIMEAVNQSLCVSLGLICGEKRAEVPRV